MLHEIHPPACRVHLDWVVRLQGRLITALCQPGVTGAVIDEDWILQAVAPLDPEPAWLEKFCGWTHNNMITLERMRAIADLPDAAKQAILAAFQNDHLFARAFDAALQQPYRLIGVSNLAAFGPPVVVLIQDFFESFYDPALYRGYRVPIDEQQYITFNRKDFLNSFDQANRDIEGVCPMCDGHRGNPKVDHFYPKREYPYLSCHPLNLTPICDDCNGPAGKFEKLPLTAEHAEPMKDWFHPYLRSAAGSFCITFTRADGPTAPVLIGADPQTQARLNNLASLSGLIVRWTKEINLDTRLCQRRISKYKAKLGHTPTQPELLTQLSEWAESAEDEAGILHFALVRHAYFEEAAAGNPIIFDELWGYAEQA